MIQLGHLYCENLKALVKRWVYVVAIHTSEKKVSTIILNDYGHCVELRMYSVAVLKTMKIVAELRPNMAHIHLSHGFKKYVKPTFEAYEVLIFDRRSFILVLPHIAPSAADKFNCVEFDPLTLDVFRVHPNVLKSKWLDSPVVGRGSLRGIKLT